MATISWGISKVLEAQDSRDDPRWSAVSNAMPLKTALFGSPSMRQIRQLLLNGLLLLNRTVSCSECSSLVGAVGIEHGPYF